MRLLYSTFKGNDENQSVQMRLNEIETNPFFA